MCNIKAQQSELSVSVQRFTKRQAADHLGVSDSTLHRMIQRGELETEREAKAGKTMVWVLVQGPDELSHESLPGLSPDSQMKGHALSPDSLLTATEPPSESSPSWADSSDENELVLLRERVRNLEDLAAYRAELLNQSELRVHELLQQVGTSQKTIEALTRALPEPAHAGRRRRWWPFGSRKQKSASPAC